MLSLKSAQEVASEFAVRIRERRLARTWTQDEMAKRSGLKTATYVLFERTGKISLIRLLKVLEVLDLLTEFDGIARGHDLAGVSLDELTQPERQRGRGRPRGEADGGSIGSIDAGTDKGRSRSLATRSPKIPRVKTS